MKNINEIGAAIASTPAIEIDSVQADGTVQFHLNLKDCGLSREDYKHPMLCKRFFLNYIGELLVRQNISKFAEILTGFDPIIYQKLVNICEHGDFGMFMDTKKSIIIFEMHLSLAQDILTEEFSKIDDQFDSQIQGSIDDFDESEKPNGNNDEDESEDF